MNGALKDSMYMTKVFKLIGVRPKKNWSNEDKYNCLFLIYTKQLSPSSYMKVRKTNIKSLARLFRWDA